MIPCDTCGATDLLELLRHLRAYRIALAVEEGQATALAALWRCVHQIDPTIIHDAERLAWKWGE